MIMKSVRTSIVEVKSYVDKEIVFKGNLKCTVGAEEDTSNILAIAGRYNKKSAIALIS